MSIAGRTLQTRRVRETFSENLEKDFLEHMKETYLEYGVGDWVITVFNRKSCGCYKFMINLYNQDATYLDRQVHDLVHLLRLVKETDEHMLLPVVAAFVTKDPHGLDEGTDLLRLLTYYLCDLNSISYPKSCEEKNELLYQGGILNDMGTRLLMTYGLEAFDPFGQALGWTAFYEREEPLVLSLLNLEKVSHLVSVQNKGDDAILIFENPAVFYAVIKATPKVKAICTSGQINLCGYQVLDLLVASNTQLIYTGDFDPEGLLIADRLKNRYKRNMTLWGFEKRYYEKILSKNEINSKRLNQLEKIRDEGLIEFATYMKQVKVAGYQEYMIEEIIAYSRTLVDMSS
ncbi:MAG: DUF2399 domain-containing protein [Vallitaleaceae bacterium]|nr:DUF2399 domain-containing protein [Vallitaleaceae bacterium]